MKNTLFFSLFSLAMLCACNSLPAGHYAIDIDLKGTLPGDSIELLKNDSIVRTVVADGNRQKIRVEEPYTETSEWAIIYYYKEVPAGKSSDLAYLSLFVDRPAHYVISGQAGFDGETDLLISAQKKGGIYSLPSMSEYVKHFNMESLMDDRYWNAVKAEKPEAEIERIFRKYEEIQFQRPAVMIRAVEKNPDEIFSAKILTMLSRLSGFEIVDSLFQTLTPRIQQSPIGQRVSEKIAAYRGKIGQPAFAFSLTDIDGQPVSLADYRGKWLMLDFWGSWCFPCRNSNPGLVEFYNRYNQHGLEILGIGRDSEQALRQAALEDGLTWRQVALSRGGIAEMVENFLVEVYPTKVLIDPQGNVELIVNGNKPKEEDPIYARVRELFP